MARKISVQLTDDLDPKLVAETTVEFGLDGAQFEIDLTHDNAEKMRRSLQPWIDSARKMSGRSRGRRPINVGDKAELAAIRAWARDAGLKVSSRGRIPSDIRAQYHAAVSK